MDFLDLLGELFIFESPAALFAGNPLVIGGTSHMKQLAGTFNGGSIVFTRHSFIAL
jgi:hypothetical protein